MILNFDDFLNENHIDDALSRAEDLLEEDQKLAEVLNDCEEGKFVCTQIVPTAGATSYVGVSVIKGSVYSNVYPTTNPRAAAVALVMECCKMHKVRDIIASLTEGGQFLNFAVFAGDRKMTPQEAAAKYQIGFDIDNSIPALTSTPVRGWGTWYS